MLCFTFLFHTSNLLKIIFPTRGLILVMGLYNNFVKHQFKWNFSPLAFSCIVDQCFSQYICDNNFVIHSNFGDPLSSEEVVSTYV